ncbi:MAG: DNA repair protein RadA [Candidatus Saganbacteria bacterium]|nr:DNA repair protein RadA [Candidatus Saganbacteria bacterium]
MSKFACQNCGAMSPSWVGKCSECGQWNTYVEEKTKAKNQKSKGKGHERQIISPVDIGSVRIEKENRFSSGIGEFDRVLGGGVLKGAAILVAGEPGIGKSTMMLQLSASLSKSGKVLYVSGEESSSQIKFRSERLSIKFGQLLLLTNTVLSEIEDQIDKLNPSVIIIDSIQTIESEEVESSAGSVSQVKECAARLVQTAKEKNIPVFIVGQVTKDGSVAGPRILEHMVDTVLYFEGEQNKNYRILRAVKNRFGSTNEIGIFEMTSKGLEEVLNPSKLLLDEGSAGSPGSAITVAMEGSRPLAVEIQALNSPSKMAVPRRVVTGLDYNRCSMIIGVLERKAGIRLSEQEIYMSVASGIYVDEPAADLPAACAIVSCVKNKAVDPKTVIIGEIGLTGEIRSVPHIEKRLQEAKKLGFTKAVFPKGNSTAIPGMKSVIVSNLKEAVSTLFE